jgi:pilus assembly protein FimV
MNFRKKINQFFWIFVCLGCVLVGSTAQAARLGALSVDSALGQPLSASIKVFEARDLTEQMVVISMASPSSYDALGLIYNDLIPRIVLRYENATQGPIIYLSTDAPVNEVVIDLHVELVTSSQTISKTFVAFLDPPLLIDEAFSIPDADNSILNLDTETLETGIEFENVISEIQVDVIDDGARLADPEITAEPQIVDVVNGDPDLSLSVAEANRGRSAQVLVRSGDTLSKIGRREQLSGFSLEQMLVGIFRKNREAFVAENMNRLRAGKIIRLPLESELAAISASEASDEVRIHIADWMTYRDGLAAKVATDGPSKADSVGRSSSGRVGDGSDKVIVDEKIKSTHVVEISSGKGAENGDVSGLEERLLATEKALAEQKKRADDLERIIADLKVLSQARQEMANVSDDEGSRGEVVTSDSAVRQNLDTTWQAQIIRLVLSQPLYLLIPVILLFVIGLWVSKKLSRIETEEEQYGAQEPLDPAGNPPAVQTGRAQMIEDPIEDADIFLAYGRYQQAGNILTQCLIAEPDNLDVLLKLAEVYSKQNDPTSFEEVAQTVSRITGQTGAYWERFVALGYLVDPNDVRYADGKFADRGQTAQNQVDLSSIDLNLGDSPTKN